MKMKTGAGRAGDPFECKEFMWHLTFVGIVSNVSFAARVCLRFKMKYWCGLKNFDVMHFIFFFNLCIKLHRFYLISEPVLSRALLTFVHLFLSIEKNNIILMNENRFWVRHFNVHLFSLWNVRKKRMNAWKNIENVQIIFQWTLSALVGWPTDESKVSEWVNEIISKSQK